MRRSTTPLQVFDFGFDLSFLEKITITYSQDDSVILQKHEGDMILEGTRARYTLTEQEVNLFNEGIVEIQGAFLTKTGKKGQTKIQRVPMLRVLDDAVMGGEADGN